MSASVIQNTVQRLYEGYGEGGLISYPRTDSTRLSNTFVNHAKEYILNKYGEEYLSDKILGISGDQDAHEAIRPTSIKLTPKKAKIKFDLNNREYKLYKLI
jgi:DNA topoisomerase-1